jgi:hypothetical protein
VGHHTRTLLQLLIEQGLDFVDESRQQVYGNQVGGTVILFEQIAVDYMRVFLQMETANLLQAQLTKVLSSSIPTASA